MRPDFASNVHTNPSVSDIVPNTRVEGHRMSCDSRHPSAAFPKWREKPEVLGQTSLLSMLSDIGDGMLLLAPLIFIGMINIQRISHISCFDWSSCMPLRIPPTSPFLPTLEPHFSLWWLFFLSNIAAYRPFPLPPGHAALGVLFLALNGQLTKENLLGKRVEAAAKMVRLAQYTFYAIDVGPLVNFVISLAASWRKRKRDRLYSRSFLLRL
jgi:hypothetical protein